MAQVVIVTGASAGIGRATADLMAARGWIVVGASRRGTSGIGWTGVVADVDDASAKPSSLPWSPSTAGSTRWWQR